MLGSYQEKHRLSQQQIACTTVYLSPEPFAEDLSEEVNGFLHRESQAYGSPPKVGDPNNPCHLPCSFSSGLSIFGGNIPKPHMLSGQMAVSSGLDPSLASLCCDAEQHSQMPTGTPWVGQG